ncbi:hypothetical protein P8452_62206 [Trifolium repens]|nr:hypothetical protein P8452_62206 [Trifolium repens]
MNIHIDSLTSKEKKLASLLHKTRQDAKQLIVSKNLDMYGMKEYIIFYLKSRQENFARLKVVNFIDQKNLIRVLEIIITFCELIDRRLPSIDQSQREVPPDMKEAIATLCFIGPRYGELPILVKVRSHFSCKYGEEYIVNLTKCKPDSCVNKKIMKLLLLPSPTKDKQNKVLIDIAKQRNFKWYPKNKCTPDVVDEDTTTSTSRKSMSHDTKCKEIVPIGIKNETRIRMRTKKKRGIVEKAGESIVTRPTAGLLRPIVHGQTQKYNMKLRAGKGFSLEELKAAGIPKKLAPTISISVDHRRKNRSLEGLQTNVQRLKTYKAKLTVFPRRARKVKAGDSTLEELANATQVQGSYLPIAREKPTVELVKVTDEMKAFKAYYKLHLERTNKRHLGKAHCRIPPKPKFLMILSKMTTKIALNPLSVQEQMSKPYATESALRTDKTILIHLRYNFSKEDLIDQCLELYNLTYSSCHVVLNEDFYVYLSFSF